MSEDCDLIGCIDPSACNYDPNATIDNGSCIYPVIFFDCDGNCLNDIDGNNICDELEGSYGCTDENACNYDPNAEIDNGSCTYSTSSDFELEFNEEYQLFNNWSMNWLDCEFDNSGTIVFYEDGSFSYLFGFDQY